jgi:DNA helicase II / ATP-dependent DNA helicase PcrA
MSLLGPNLILAGPGTGKTTFLINKTFEIFRSVKAKNDGIIICTFTRKATEELTTRLYSKLEVRDINKVNFIIGTIHSICFDLLARYSEKDYGDYQILPEESQIHFIHSKLKNLGYSNDRIKKNGWTLSEELATIYNKINDEKIDYSNLDFKDDVELEEACHTYPTYRRLLERNRLFDFASIQSTFLKELKESPSFKKKIQADFKYYLVDEYQDVNNLQNEIFISLSEPYFNLTIVGDDDQSIYGFRGSSVDHIRNFESELKGKGKNVKIDILNTNYRSTERIVKYSNTLLEKMAYKRIEKGIMAKRVGYSHPVVIREFQTEDEEGTYIVKTIHDLIANNVVTSFSQVAILFRSLKGHSDGVISALNISGIPYKLVGAGNFFDSLIGKEFLVLLDYYLAKDIDNTQMFFDNLAQIDVSTNSDLTTLYSQGDYLQHLENIFKKKNYKSCIDLTYDLFIGTEFLKRHYNEGPNLGKLTDIVLKFDDFSDRFDPWGLYSYLTYLMKSNDVDYIHVSGIEAVNMFTIHQSKGLEFPVVFMPSQIERNKRTSFVDRLIKLTNGKKDDTDEDGRVLYVGCTRAEDLLIISGSKTLTKTNKEYSFNSLIKTVNQYITTSTDLDFKKLKQHKFRNSVNLLKQNTVISYNKISLYNYCPRAFMYAHIWNLQTVRIGGLEFGRNIHKIIEIILRNIIANVPVNKIGIDELIENNWKNANFRNDDENEKFKMSAKKQINTFINKCSNYLESAKVFSVEDQFNITVDDNLITGRFDAVFQENGSYIIIDFKTGDRRDYSSQLSFYNLCFKQKYNPTKEVKLAVYYMKEGALEFIVPNEEEVVLEKINNVSKAIAHNEFIASPGKICKDCSFSNICEYSI